MRQLFLILSLTILISSCSNPLNKKYNDTTLKEDAKAIRESKKLSDEELDILGSYIVGAKMGEKDLDGMTYSEILKKAKDIKAEQKALAEKIEKEEESKRQKFSQAVNFSLYNIGYAKADYDDYLTYDVAFENKSGKDIKAIKGNLRITDLFDKKIKEFNVVFDEGIIAGETKKTSYTTDYNQFMDEDKEMKSKTIKEVKFIWTPEKIIFTDGTTLE